MPPPKLYLFHLFTSRNAKKTQTHQTIPRVFLLYLKRKDPPTFKNGSWKKLFLQCVCYWCSLLQWMFFILHDNWKTLLFSESLSIPWDFFKLHVAAFFEASVERIRILCAVPIMTQMIYLPSFFDTNFNFVTIPDFSNDVFPYKRNFSLETQILAGSMFPDCTILLSLLRRHWIQNKEQD